MSIVNAQNARPTRKLVLLGASGSIGRSTLDYLSTETDIELLAASIHRSVQIVPELLSRGLKWLTITDEATFVKEGAALEKRHPGLHVFGAEPGMEAMLQEVRAVGADTVLTAIVGAAGLKATITAIKLGYKIALANKETLVTAGGCIRELLELMSPAERPAILPVDSEHNAIFQLISSLNPQSLGRIILTASGGPFRTLPLDQLSRVSQADVLNHPTWSMGPKITVDSAGMINKGLEVIEAHFLFGLPYAAIDVLIHPQSLIHGMVELKDGSYLMAGAAPSMQFPIAHALHYPEPVPRPHLAARPPEAWKALEFQKVDTARYPGYDLCRAAGEKGGLAPAILNAANEVLVESFLEGRIPFAQIPIFLKRALTEVFGFSPATLDDYLKADREARQFVKTLLEKEVAA